MRQHFWFILKLDHQSDNAENWPGPDGTTPKISSKRINTTIRW